MSNHSDVLTENRRNLRVKENASVSWSVNESQTQGVGKIKNISLTGMLMETNSDFTPRDGYVFSFNSPDANEQFLPSNGRLVWYKKKSSNRNEYLCGIEFVNPPSDVMPRLDQRVQEGIARTENSKKMEGLLSAVLLFAILGVALYIVYLGNTLNEDIRSTNDKISAVANEQAALTQSYAHRYYATEIKLASVTEELNTTKVELDSTKQELETTQKMFQDSQTMLAGVSGDLTATKEVMVQTEYMLNQLNEGKDPFTGDTELFKNLSKKQISEIKADLQSTVSNLQKKYSKLNSEMDTLRNQVSYYEGNVKNMDEGKGLLKTYYNNIRLVKGKIRNFIQEAQEVRIAAMKERDRVRMVLGNNGFLTRDGQSVRVDDEKYKSAVLTGNEPAKPEVKSDRKVKVDVNFFE